MTASNRPRTAWVQIITVAVMYLSVGSAFGWRANSQARRGEPISEVLSVTSPKLSRSQGMPKAVLVFQPTDCEQQGDKLTWWNEVLATGDIAVVGIVVSSKRTTIARLVQRYQIKYPVVVASNAKTVEAVQALGYQRTPLAIIADGDGRIRFTAPISDFRSKEDVLRIAHAVLPRPIPQSPGTDGQGRNQRHSDGI